MGMPNIGELTERSDPLTEWMWKVRGDTFPAPSGVTGVSTLYVETFDLSFSNIKVEDSLFGGGGYSYFPGFHDCSAFSVTFYEDSQASTLKFIKEWKAKIKNFSSGVYNPPSEYKVDNLIVDLFDTKGNVALSVKLNGVWPAETSNLSLDTSSTNRLRITQSFSVDNVDY